MRVALLLSCACAPAPPAVHRVALITDTHVIGPDYACCSESPGIDNTSIIKTGDRLQAVSDTLNDLEPPVEAVFVLGDVMHDAYPYGDDVFAYLDGASAFSVSRDLFATFEAPVYRLWGNHDYAVKCGAGGIPREVSADLFVRFHDEPERQAVDVGDFRFLLLNGQLGPTWDPPDPRCDTDKGSFGAEQLGWAADQLADAATTGKRSFVLSHYMKAVTARGEDPNGAWPDLHAVLAAHPPELTFAGHTHRWLDLRADTEFPHVVVAATRYDVDNFWVVELTDAGDETPPSWRIEDEGKAQWFSPCAATWAYDGGPRPVEGAAETGDCGP